MKRTLFAVAIVSLCSIANGDILNKALLKGSYLKVGIGEVKYKKYIGSEAFKAKAPLTKSIYNFGIGYKTNDVWRFEALLNFLRAHYKYSDNKGYRIDQATSVLALVVNSYYDFDVFKVKHIVPYIGMGLGVARHKSGSADMRLKYITVPPYKGANKYSFALNIGLGLKYDFSNKISCDLGYRYFDYGKFKLKKSVSRVNDIEQKVAGHQAILSFNFNIF